MDIVQTAVAATHFVMTSFKTTEKAMTALIQGIPLVTPEFFFKMHDDYVAASVGQGKHVEFPSNFAMPDPGQYQPEIADANVQNRIFSLSIDTGRKQLFEGMSFILFNDDQVCPPRYRNFIPQAY